MGILLALSVVLLAAGCAGTSSIATGDGKVSDDTSRPDRMLVAAGEASVIADLPTVATKKSPLGGSADELFGGEEYDPWESFNTMVFEFNRKVDKYALKPVAQGYDFIIPDFVQVGISNIFYNLRFPQRFLNNVFQGKFKFAVIQAGRLLINTAVGYAGFI